MSVAACLLVYSLAVAVLGPRLLPRLTRAGVAPRLGLAVWLAAIGSVAGSWLAAAGLLFTNLVRDWNQPGRILDSCFAALRSVATGRSGVLVQIGLFTLAAAAALAVTVLTTKLARSLVRARASTHRHARMARLTGRQITGQDAVVLQAPQRAAYCAAGRPHTIVITSAAQDALDDRHLGAVLSHERAHLAGRHHLIIAAARGLARILPRVRLFTTGTAEIARMLEMCADDVAARRHGRQTVLGALLTLSGVAPVPSGALGATAVAVLARAERLADPPATAQQWRARLLLGAATAVLLAGPVLTGALAAAGLAFCLPMTG